VARLKVNPEEVGRRLTEYIYEERLVGEWAGEDEAAACLLPEATRGT
jgi:hypothetical protein